MAAISIRSSSAYDSEEDSDEHRAFVMRTRARRLEDLRLGADTAQKPKV